MGPPLWNEVSLFFSLHRAKNRTFRETRMAAPSGKYLRTQGAVRSLTALKQAVEAIKTSAKAAGQSKSISAEQGRASSTPGKTKPKSIESTRSNQNQMKASAAADRIDQRQRRE